MQASVVQVDYCLVKPVEGLDVMFSPLTGAAVERVPVVRVFGATPGGQRACVHLHKALPYIYVPYFPDLPEAPEAAGAVLQKLALAVDGALRLNKNVAARYQSSKRAHVHSCDLVLAKPFYGYDPGEGLFVKIFLYNPGDITRAATLLQSGGILGRRWQPHEAHIPYLLQVKQDFNFVGMGMLHFSQCLFRLPLPRKPREELWRPQGAAPPPEDAGLTLRLEETPAETDHQLWTAQTVPAAWRHHEDGPEKDSTCELELDVLVEHIQNRLEVKYTPLEKAGEHVQMIPSLAPVWAEERHRRNKDGLGSLPLPPASPHRVPQVLAADFQQRLRRTVDIVAAQDRQRVQPGAGASNAPKSLGPAASPLLDLTQRANLFSPIDSPRKSLLPPRQAGAAELALDGLLQADIVTSQGAEEATQAEIAEMCDIIMWMQDMEEGGGEEAGDTPGKDEIHCSQPRGSQPNTQREAKLLLETALNAFVSQSQKECRDILAANEEADGPEPEPEEEEGGSGEDGGGPELPESRPASAAQRAAFRLALTDSNDDAIEPAAPAAGDPAAGGPGAAGAAPASEATSSICETVDAAEEIRRKFAPHEESPHAEVASLAAVPSPPSDGKLGTATPSAGAAAPSPTEVEHTQPFYSKSQDIPSKPVVFAGRRYDPPTKAANDRSKRKKVKFSDGPRETADFATDANTGALISQHNGAYMSQDGSVLQTPGTASGSQAVLHAARGPAPCTDRSKAFWDLLFPGGQKGENGAPPEAPGGKEALHLQLEPSSDEGSDGERVVPSPKFDERTFHFQDAAVDVEPKKKRKLAAGNKFVSQITPPSVTPKSTGKKQRSTPSSERGLKFKALKKDSSAAPAPSVLSVEMLARSSGSLLSNPPLDAVVLIVLALKDARVDVDSPDGAVRILASREGMDEALVPLTRRANKLGIVKYHVEWFDTEAALYAAFVHSVVEADPDVIVGFEIQGGSLGYLNDRHHHLLQGVPEDQREKLLRQLSRTPRGAENPQESRDDDYGRLHGAGMHSAGRIILNLWRLFRMELKLSSYSFHNCVHAILKQRVPRFEQQVLDAWFQSGQLWRSVEHVALRATLNLRMIDAIDLVGRTAEFAKVFGIDFFSVLSRGSQYRVESLLVRLAHTQNYVMMSPSKEQVANQPAMEALPLVMEPESRFYPDPVVVLDFQSLYPSCMMAYNICYSTFLGKFNSAVRGWPKRLGARIEPPKRFPLVGDLDPANLIFAPNGAVFVKPEHRVGVLSRMVEEILATRQMIKRVMKEVPSSKQSLKRLLNARQLGLKLLANVTYGYASAGFSGRMPCAEIADAIVQCGRETLENAIRTIEAHPRWNARVVYGDTDSVFVLLEGRSREAAHRIGAEIAEAVTAANPSPVRLECEKVYHPCVLLSKKRYVGFAYEAADQKRPVFDAKGIETVRRDSCPVVAKMMERSLRLLFSTKDLSLVKSYLLRQWTKILSNRINIQDFVFCKEVRLGTYSVRAAVMPPAAIVAAKAMSIDQRAEPKYGERVPYVVIHGEPGARLVDMVVAPRVLAECRGTLRLHGVYYITKQIVPALERCFSLFGVDVKGWYLEMPKPLRILPTKRPLASLAVGGGARSAFGRAESSRAATIDSFFDSRHCLVCDGLTAAQKPICDECQLNAQFTSLYLTSRVARLERSNQTIARVCMGCGGARGTGDGGVACTSLDCGVYFEREKVAHELVVSREGQAKAHDLL